MVVIGEVVLKEKETKMKRTVKFIIEVGEEVIECDSFEEAEKKMKNLIQAETEAYLIKKEYEDKVLIEETLMG